MYRLLATITILSTFTLNAKEPKFRQQDIDVEVGVGYGLQLADMNGDGKTDGLRAFDDVKVIGPMSLEGREGIVSFNLEGTESPDLVQEFATRGIRVHARISDGYSGHILGPLGVEDCLRVSMCHYNSPDEVRQFLGALKEIRAAG